MKDNINPSHYRQGSVECIDALDAATVNKKDWMQSVLLT